MAIDRRTLLKGVSLAILAVPGIPAAVVLAEEFVEEIKNLKPGHDLTLCSTDGDLARVPKLRWSNPIA